MPDRRASTDMVEVEGARIRALRLRRKRRRRNDALLTAAAVVLALVAVGAVLVHRSARVRAPAAAASSRDPVPGPAPSGPPPSFPVSGPGTFAYAAGSDEVLGAGTAAPKSYRVAVEDRTGQDVAGFAREVRAVLADPRGWTAGGDVRFQQLARDAAKVDFTVTLAT